MIFGNRLVLTLELETGAPLHVGAGICRTDPKLQKTDMDEAPEVLLVQRDRAGQPIIPATSLKGALRAATDLSAAALDRLLGEQGEAAEGRGRIARLWLGTAVGTTPGDANAGHRGSTTETGLRAHGFVKTGVQIERTTGAAEARKLFHREVVGRKTTFEGEATLFLDELDAATEADLLADLSALLAPLYQAPGLPLGGQKRQATGRLRLQTLSVVRKSIDPATLDLVDSAEPALARDLIRCAQAVQPTRAAPIRLGLSCPGPFISIRDKPKESNNRQVTMPLESDDKPLLWPSSLLGVLRARAAWFAARTVLRQDHRFAPDREPKDVDDRGKVVRKVSEVAALSSVERLFGVAGWRGLLRVASLEPAADATPRRKRLTSVTIDRFTGGAMDERLFTEETFLGAAFTADLRLDERGAYPTTADRDFLDLLLDDVGKRGLELGHGGAKGFGWFSVRVTRPAAGVIA